MKGELFLSVILLLSSFCVSESTEDSEFTPENTVILSNETDASFCRDFSVILRRLRPEWVILGNVEVPESVRDWNLIIIGKLDAEYTGAIIGEFLSQEESDYIEDGHYSILERESLWADTEILIYVGSDNLKTKKAAEEAVISLEGEWTHPPFPVYPVRKG